VRITSTGLLRVGGRGFRIRPGPIAGLVPGRDPARAWGQGWAPRRARPSPTGPGSRPRSRDEVGARARLSIAYIERTAGKCW